jgi:hypothetical protein
VLKVPTWWCPRSSVIGKSWQLPLHCNTRLRVFCCVRVEQLQQSVLLRLRGEVSSLGGACKEHRMDATIRHGWMAADTASS